MNSLEKTLNINSLGQFKTVELIEIVGWMKNSSPFNIFTIAIAQEDNLENELDSKLSNKSLNIKKQKGLKVGVFKSILPIDDFLEKTKSLASNKWFNSSGEPLLYGVLRPLAKVFAPYTDNPKNDYLGLLKNNFFGGSYVFEWFDESKEYTQILINNHLALEEVSTKIQEILPIKIGAHSDRLGNFIVQIPCMAVCLGGMKKDKTSNNMIVNVQISPHFDANQVQQLSGIFWREENQNLIDFHKQAIQLGENIIPFQSVNGGTHLTIWDEANQIICVGYQTKGFVEFVSTKINTVEHRQRRIRLPNGNDCSISIETLVSQSLTPQQDYRTHKQKRLVSVEKTDLKQKGFLLQFHQNSRDDALRSIRKLIVEYGKYGVCLWDPYLSANDLLETVVFAPYANVSIKALSGLKSMDNARDQDTILSYQTTLNDAILDEAWLKLAFLKADISCPSFHDRFLIFPKSQYSPAQAWSLGTSVNSLGKSHHIIQKVNDAQIIEDVFNNFWSQSISKEENIIWKSTTF